MVPTSPFHRLRSLIRRVRLGVAATHGHREAEAPLALPRRTDGPAAAAQLARDLLRHRPEDITLVIYLDDRHRLVGSVIVAVGWVQAARLSARSILAGSIAWRATSCFFVRYRRWGALSTTEPEARSFRTLAAICIRYGLLLVDHVIVTEGGRFASAALGQAG